MFCLFSTSWRSGEGWFTRELVNGLASIGERVIFIAPLRENSDPTVNHDLIERRLLPRVTSSEEPWIVRRAMTIARSSTAIYQLLRARLRTRVFVLNFIGGLPFQIAFAILLRITRARVIFVTHDPTPHKWVMQGWLRELEICAHKLAYATVSHIVCLSSQSKKALQDVFRIAPEKILIIPHGAFDLGAIERIPGPTTLLLFGTFRRNKSIREAIEAVILLRNEGFDIRLRISGGVHIQDPSYLSECVEKAKERPEAFQFDLRYIPDAELPSIIASVDAFLLPYAHFNSQSGVGILAVISGRAIIASSSGGLSDLFSYGAVGISINEPVTVDSIAAAIRSYLLVENAKWIVDCACAREKLLNRLSWTRIAKQYADLVDKYTM